MSQFLLGHAARPVVGKDPVYQHRFGGAPRHKGSLPIPDSSPLHLLYILDTADPNCPIRVPGIRFLPLYFGLAYGGGEMGYRVLSDDTIEIVFMESSEVELDFPYPNSPREFSETPVTLLSLSYEHQKVLVCNIACEELEIYDEFLSEADRGFLRESGYPFTQFGGIQRMPQGIPDSGCLNKSCRSFKREDHMEVFGVVWGSPIPDVYLWSEDGEDYIQIIYQICRNCQCICVCSRS